MYDSSIPEPFPTATSPDGNTRLWPYTMDHGLPQRCDLGTGEALLPLMLCKQLFAGSASTELTAMLMGQDVVARPGHRACGAP